MPELNDKEKYILVSTSLQIAREYQRHPALPGMLDWDAVERRFLLLRTLEFYNIEHERFIDKITTVISIILKARA